MKEEKGYKFRKRLTRLLITNFILILIFFLLLINHCGAQWYQISLPVSGSVYQMQFVNQNTGWASIYHGYDDFYLIKTTNSGSDWDIIFHDSAKVQNFQFINDTLGYARGVGYLTHYMLKTTNSGYNWTIMQDSPGYVFSGFYMVGADTGYVEVWYFNPPFSNEFIFKTVDGFQTLDTISTGIGGGATSKMYFLKEKYNGEYCGFILGGGTLLKSTNSGYNWQQFSFGEYGNVNSFSFVNKDTGWIVFLPTVAQSSRILYTSNGGQNWIQQFSTNSQNDFGIVQAVNKRRIWCGTIYNKLLISTDAGLNWGKQICPILPPNIYMFDTIFGFAWNTYQIVKTTNGGGPILSVEKRFNNFPSTNELEQNFPNPFNAETSIKYQVKKSADIKIVVYNINGKKVVTLVTEKKPLGDYEVKFNGNYLSSGIYFYSLYADGERVGTKRMVLLK